MDESPRFTLNRGVVILRHRQPFLDWVMQADPEPLEHLTLASLAEDGDAFLIPGGPAIDNSEDAVRWVEKRWRMFFEHMLSDWFTDEALWPKNLSLKMFREWFAVEYCSIVWDVANEQLEIEDWEVDDDPAGSLH